MIPILYEVGEMSFTTEGIGRLVDCVECIVTEERNGIYECEFTYPVDGRHYSDIQEGRIISVIHDDSRTVQPFDIYGRSAPLNGLVTFYAHHVSYRLGSVVLRPFSSQNVAITLSQFHLYAMTGNPFSFWTDKTDGGNFSLDVPKNVREVLGGSDGSILDVFNGGEYEFDKFQVKLYANRGNDTEVEIRYGKNLTDLKHDVDVSGTYNAVVPYYKSGDDSLVISGSIVTSSAVVPDSFAFTTNTGEEITTNNGATIEFFTAEYNVAPLDLSGSFDEKPTQAALIEEAQAYMAKNKPWDPSENITVDFVALWQMPEYEQYTSLQRVRLCDTVSVIYKELGTNAVRQKVIKTVYDVLNERYNSIELGQTERTLAQTIQLGTEKILENVPSRSMMADAIAEATTKIMGGRGGHVVFNTDGQGNPDEILIMDTANINTAVSVIRINQNGIGFSQNGYQGPFRSAWTIDGKFNADFITAGQINTNLIKTGSITSNDGSVYFDLDHNLLVCNRVHGSIPKDVGSYAYNGTPIIDTSYDRVSGKGYYTYVRIYKDYAENNTNTIYIEPAQGYVEGTQWDVSTASRIYTRDGNTPIRMAFASSDYQSKCWVECGKESTYSSGAEKHYYVDLRVGGTSGQNGSGGTGIHIQDEKRYGNGNILEYAGVYITGGRLSASNASLGSVSCSSLNVTGTKSRIVDTEDYGRRYLYSYETPAPMFGDIGEGEIGEDGVCYVWIESIFNETVSKSGYQVFLQKYGEGDCYVSKKTSAYFLVAGTPSMRFGWELKAKQADFEQIRLEKDFGEDIERTKIDYGEDGAAYYRMLIGGRIL